MTYRNEWGNIPDPVKYQIRLIGTRRWQTVLHDAYWRAADDARYERRVVKA